MNHIETSRKDTQIKDRFSSPKAIKKEARKIRTLMDVEQYLHSLREAAMERGALITHLDQTLARRNAIATAAVGMVTVAGTLIWTATSQYEISGLSLGAALAFTALGVAASVYGSYRLFELAREEKSMPAITAEEVEKSGKVMKYFGPQRSYGMPLVVTASALEGGLAGWAVGGLLSPTMPLAFHLACSGLVIVGLTALGGAAVLAVRKRTSKLRLRYRVHALEEMVSFGHKDKQDELGFVDAVSNPQIGDNHETPSTREWVLALAPAVLCCVPIIALASMRLGSSTLGDLAVVALGGLASILAAAACFSAATGAELPPEVGGTAAKIHARYPTVPSFKEHLRVHTSTMRQWANEAARSVRAAMVPLDKRKREEDLLTKFGSPFPAESAPSAQPAEPTKIIDKGQVGKSDASESISSTVVTPIHQGLNGSLAKMASDNPSWTSGSWRLS